MEIKLILNQSLLPKLANAYAFSVVKRLIFLGDKSLYGEYYEENPKDKKPFSFSLLYKGSFTGEFFLLDRNPVLRISTTNARLLKALLRGIEEFGSYEFYLSEHLKDTATLKLISVQKKIISNVLQMDSFLLPYRAYDFIEKTKGMSLEEKVRFYFREKGLTVRHIYWLKKKKLLWHKIREDVFPVEPIALRVKVEARDKQTLIELTYNGLGWLKSEGFGYVVPVRKKVEVIRNGGDLDKSKL